MRVDLPEPSSKMGVRLTELKNEAKMGAAEPAALLLTERV